MLSEPQLDKISPSSELSHHAMWPPWAPLNIYRLIGLDVLGMCLIPQIDCELLSNKGLPIVLQISVGIKTVPYTE